MLNCFGDGEGDFTIYNGTNVPSWLPILGALQSELSNSGSGCASLGNERCLVLESMWLKTYSSITAADDYSYITLPNRRNENAHEQKWSDWEQSPHLTWTRRLYL